MNHWHSIYIATLYGHLSTHFVINLPIVQYIANSNHQSMRAFEEREFGWIELLKNGAGHVQLQVTSADWTE
jgi:hypothetical protein